MLLRSEVLEPVGSLVYYGVSTVVYDESFAQIIVRPVVVVVIWKHVVLVRPDRPGAHGLVMEFRFPARCEMHYLNRVTVTDRDIVGDVRDYLLYNDIAA